MYFLRNKMLLLIKLVVTSLIHLISIAKKYNKPKVGVQIIFLRT